MRTGHLVYGMLKTPTLRNALFNTQHRIPENPDGQARERIRRAAGLVERNDGARQRARAGSQRRAPAAFQGGEEKALERYSVDLTAKARKGEIDPIVGRDDEIRQVIDILLRRRQNNPILVGEAGVGKTAVAEGFAKRIADGDMPPALQGVTLRALDIGLMQAGASMKGEFEKRLRGRDRRSRNPAPSRSSCSSTKRTP